MKYDECQNARAQIFHLKGLKKRFGGQYVLNDINLSVAAGETLVIMGPSGCGKTTLIRCFNLLERPDAGELRFLGKDILSKGVDINKIRSKIGFVFQNFALYRHLTVLENITLALIKLKKQTRRRAAARAREELNYLGMIAHENKYPAQLSGGQKQRVALARALVMEPEIIILDEPTSALDPLMSQEVALLIRRLESRKITTICVTHDIGFASQISDNVAFMYAGKIVARGSIKQLSAAPLFPEMGWFFGRRRDE